MKLVRAWGAVLGGKWHLPPAGQERGQGAGEPPLWKPGPLPLEQQDSHRSLATALLSSSVHLRIAEVASFQALHILLNLWLCRSWGGMCDPCSQVTGVCARCIGAGEPRQRRQRSAWAAGASVPGPGWGLVGQRHEAYGIPTAWECCPVGKAGWGADRRRGRALGPQRLARPRDPGTGLRPVSRPWRQPGPGCPSSGKEG